MAQVKEWTFTSYDLENFKVPDDFKWFQYCVYQAETCPTTGNIHLQGYIEFKRSIRWQKVQELIGDPVAHVDVRHGTRQQARDYCMKLDTRYADPIEFGLFTGSKSGQRTDLAFARITIQSKRKLEDVYTDSTLDSVTTKYPNWVAQVHASRPRPDIAPPDINLTEWQHDVLTILSGPPKHRQIIWIWSDASRTGKSTFFAYCSHKYDILPAAGTLPDLLYSYDDNQVIWFDLTRASNGYEPYAKLETLSNHGYVLSTKYRPIRKYIKSHVVVTSNRPPDESKLPDRFIVFHAPPLTNSQEAQGPPPRSRILGLDASLEGLSGHLGAKSGLLPAAGQLISDCGNNEEDVDLEILEFIKNC